MIKYPASIDSSIELPTVLDNITPISGALINNIRDAVISIESELGIKPSGIYANVRTRLNALELGVNNLINIGGSFGGDIAGVNNTTQKVVGLQGNPIDSLNPSDGDVLTWSDTDNAWTPSPTGASSSFTAAGDLAGTNSSQIVLKIHGASVPIAGSLTVGNGLHVTGTSTLAYGALNLAGGANFVIGVLPTANQALQTMGGDVTGTTAASVVTKLQTIPVNATAPLDGYVLTYDNVNEYWKPASTSSTFTAAGDLSGSGTSQNVIKIRGVSVNAGSPNDGQVLTYKVFSNDLEYQDQVANLAGDLSGTTASATVIKVNGVSVPPGGTITVGTILRVTSGTSLGYGALDLANINAVTGVLPIGNQASQTVGADLSGTTASATVIKVRGNPVQSATYGGLQDGYVWTWVNTSNQVQMKPIPTQTATGSAAGDLSGTYPNPTVAKINTATVPAAGTLTTGNVLQVTGSSALSYAPVNLAGGANFVTGTLPSSNQDSQTLVGDVSGTTAASIVDKIKGNAVQTATYSATQDGYVYTWVNSASLIEMKPIPIQTATGVAGGDLSGTYPNPIVVQITGSGGVASIPTAALAFGASPATTGNIRLSDASSVKVRDSVANRNVNVFNFTNGGGGPGTIALGDTNNQISYTAASNHNFFNGTSQTILASNGFTFPNNAGVVSLNVATLGTNSGVGLTVKAGDTSQTGFDGGTLLLQTGGATTGGPGAFQVGIGSGNSALLIQAVKKQIPGGNTGRVVSLVRDPAISSTELPVNTGDLVVYIGNAATAPTANPTSGVILYSNSGVLTVRQPNGTTVPIVTFALPTAPGAGYSLISTGTSTQTWATIVDGYVSASAAIAGTKISPNFGSQNILTSGTLGAGATTVTSFTNSSLGVGVGHFDSSGNETSSLIVNADISSSAAITISKLSSGTSAQVLLNNATPTPTWTTFTGDMTVGSTGTTLVSKINGTSVPSTPTANQVLVATGTTASVWSQIFDGYVASSAAIAGTKISPNFGSQNILTSGTLGSGALTATSIRDSGLGTGVVHSDGSGNFTSSTIVNVDVSASAAIAGTKISPDFGSQNVLTTGSVTGSSFVGNSLDRASSGALSIGITNATSISIGGVSIPTTINGNLTVNGTTTTINSTTVDIADRIIHVNHSTGIVAVPSNITGISVHRGSADGITDRDHAGLFWDETNSRFKLAFNTTGDDSTLGANLPLTASGATLSGMTTGRVVTTSTGGLLVDTAVLPVGNLPSLAGDVTGTITANTVLSLTGAAGVINIASTGNALTWNIAASNPTITQNNSSGATGKQMLMSAQASGTDGYNGGELRLRAGDGYLGGTNSRGGDLTLKSGQTSLLTTGRDGYINFNLGQLGNFARWMNNNSSGAGVSQVALEFIKNNVTTPEIRIETSETRPVGTSLSVKAQSSTFAGSTGGQLILTSGSGITAAGSVVIQAGGATRLTAASDGSVTVKEFLSIAPTAAGPVATDGYIRLPFSSSMVGRNSANTKNLQIFQTVNDTSFTEFGGNQEILMIGSDYSHTANRIFDQVFIVSNYLAGMGTTGAAYLAYNNFLTVTQNANLNIGGGTISDTPTHEFGDGYGMLRIGDASTLPTANISGGTLVYSNNSGFNVDGYYLGVRSDVASPISTVGTLRMPTGASLTYRSSDNSHNVFAISSSSWNNPPFNPPSGLQEVLSIGADFVTYDPATAYDAVYISANDYIAITTTDTSGFGGLTVQGDNVLVGARGNFSVQGNLFGLPDLHDGYGVMYLGNAYAVPTAGNADGVIFYSEGGIAKVRQSDGTIIPITTGGSIFTPGGDLTGSSSSQQVISITGSAGTVSIANTANNLSWISTTTSPKLRQNSVTTASATGQPLTLQAQNATGTTSTGGALVLLSGSGTSQDGYIQFVSGTSSTNLFNVYSQVVSPGTALEFNAATPGASGVVFKIAQSSTNTTGVPFQLNAQSTTAASSTGGNVNISAGLGTSAAGQIRFRAPNVNGTLDTNITFKQTNSSVASIEFANTIAPTINNASSSVHDGYAFTIQAQTATGGFAGGNLLLKSGTGTTVDGYVALQVGSTTVAQATTNKFVSNRGARKNVTTITGTYIILVTDENVIVTTNAAAFTITMPSSPTIGDWYTIKDGVGNAAAKNLTIAGNGKNIDGSSTYTINNNYAAITIVYNGTEWSVL